MSRDEATRAPERVRGRFGWLERALGVLGTVLAGLALAAPFALALVSLASGRGGRLDYLMPGELFPFVGMGGAALLAAALIARRERTVVAIAFGSAALLFALTNVFAVVTGLAFGATEAAGWPLALVAGTYALYVLAVIAVFVAGVLTCRALFAPTPGRPRAG